MIKGIGIDIVELERIYALNQRKPAFKQRILTSAELEQYEALNKRLNENRSTECMQTGPGPAESVQTERRATEYLAGRFAAKEAFAKALGTGIGGACTWHDVAILSQRNGSPKVIWVNQPANTFIHLSISHGKTCAVAQVIIEEIS